VLLLRARVVCAPIWIGVSGTNDMKLAAPVRKIVTPLHPQLADGSTRSGRSGDERAMTLGTINVM